MKQLTDSDKRRIRFYAIQTVLKRYLRRKELNTLVGPGTLRDKLIGKPGSQVTSHHSWVTKVHEYLLSMGGSEHDSLISISPKGLGFSDSGPDDIPDDLLQRYAKACVQSSTADTTGIPVISLLENSDYVIHVQARHALHTVTHSAKSPCLNIFNTSAYCEDVIKAFNEYLQNAQLQGEVVRKFLVDNAMRYMLHHMAHWVLQSALEKAGYPTPPEGSRRMGLFPSTTDEKSYPEADYKCDGDVLDMEKQIAYLERRIAYAKEVDAWVAKHGSPYAYAARAFVKYVKDNIELVLVNEKYAAVTPFLMYLYELEDVESMFNLDAQGLPVVGQSTTKKARFSLA